MQKYLAGYDLWQIHVYFLGPLCSRKAGNDATLKITEDKYSVHLAEAFTFLCRQMRDLTSQFLFILIEKVV